MHFTELQACQNGHKKPKESPIWYYGISYGTVIGHTLEVMYPDRTGRIIVDSNINSEGYYNGLTPTAVEGVDDCYDRFFSLCYEARRKKSAFIGDSSSARDVKHRFDDLLASLEEESVMVSDTSLASHRRSSPNLGSRARLGKHCTTRTPSEH
ncbi:hypothetical protein EJ02DRAFT_75256 [Clathrospora elynae]|uniref:AB hydrolase-1 domain-containing protein n=1 Tax=Clathrospora elynae TaxID=706981 RepID=A0A6A5SBA2_9PLEO|nr:hypothetical protein EJ02DRAFT_75256 [Clathrospora elynae]